MHNLIEWFSKKYADIKWEMQRCHHSFAKGEVNPYHIEDDCWSHTMMVCKICELKGYGIEVQTASLLHDIGKPKSREIKHGRYVYFKGHEEISAKMAKPILQEMAKDGLIKKEQIDTILELILMHGYLQKQSDVDAVIEEFKGREDFLKLLVQVSECDDIGRFAKSVNIGVEFREEILGKVLRGAKE